MPCSEGRGELSCVDALAKTVPEFAVRLGGMERRQGLGTGVWFRILPWEDS